MKRQKEAKRGKKRHVKEAKGKCLLLPSLSMEKAKRGILRCPRFKLNHGKKEKESDEEKFGANTAQQS